MQALYLEKTAEAVLPATETTPSIQYRSFQINFITKNILDLSVTLTPKDAEKLLKTNVTTASVENSFCVRTAARNSDAEAVSKDDA